MNIDQLKKVIAVLAASIVQTLNEADRAAQKRFLTRLEAGYLNLRDDDRLDRNALELLCWTRILLGAKP